MPGYRERLTPPWWGWVLAAFWASTLGIAYGYAITVPVGWAVGGGLFVVAAVTIVALSAVVEVNDSTLRAGRASVPLSAVGSVRPLDAAAARIARGTGADPRAFTLLRGWIGPAVIVELRDQGDPTPYWYVSSRRPDTLAKAIARHRAGVDVAGSDASGSRRSSMGTQESSDGPSPAVVTVAALAAGVVAQRLVSAGWRFVRGREPDSDDSPLPELLIFAAVSAATAAVARNWVSHRTKRMSR